MSEGIARNGIARLGIAVKGIAQRGIAGVGGAIGPVTEDLIQWLYKLPFIGSLLPDNSGRDNTALKVGSAAVGVNGLDQYGFANNTGLGAGNFYYERRGKIITSVSGRYIFSDGGGFAGGKRAAVLQTSAVSGGFTFVLDDDVLPVSASVATGGALDGRNFLIKFYRIGTTCTGYAKDLDSGVEYSVTFEASTDYSSTQPLGLGALWNQDLSVWVNHSNADEYCFKAGTSAENITENIHFAGLSGPTCANTANPSNPMTLVEGSGSFPVMRSPDQDLVHANFDNGGSKELESVSAFKILAPHLTGAETVVSWNGSMAEPTVALGEINFDAGWLREVVLSDGTIYKISGAYNNGTNLTIKDTGGTNDGIAVATLEHFEPATDANPFIDTRGLPCTNVADGKTHNYCETEMEQDVTAPDWDELKTRDLFSDDGITPRRYTIGELIEYTSYYQNIVAARRYDEYGLLRCYDLLTYLLAKFWTPSEYAKNLNYTKDVGPTMVFAIDDNEEYAIDDNGNYILGEEG